MKSTVALALVAAATIPLCSASLYSKNSHVLQIDGRKYQTLIANSNHTSIVEFYAPWCGHCKSLQPAYEKVAKALKGIAKVAAVNCDEEANKPFCGSMGVQGFPTLKIVRPGKKPGRPTVEDYQGARSAKDIAAAVKDKVTNHVKRVTAKTIDEFLGDTPGQPKAILFTEKGGTSALLKAIAIDYLDKIPVAQVRDKEKAIVGKYGITSFPTLLLIPGDGAEPIKYAGKIEKDPMMNFLSQAAVPNPDPAPKAPKAKSTPAKKASADSSKLSKASRVQKSKDSKATQTTETLEKPLTESPGPIVSPDAQKPIKLDQVRDGSDGEYATVPSFFTDAEAKEKCLTTASGTCLLIFNPVNPSGEQGVETSMALTSLAQIHNKHAQRGGKMFPFYNVVRGDVLRKELDLGERLAIIAINGKKGWMRRFESDGMVTRRDLEDWIDGVRMGEGKKSKVPAGVLLSESAAKAAAAAERPSEEVVAVVEEAVKESTSVGAEKIVRATGQAKAAAGQAKEKIEEVVEQIKEKIVLKKEDETVNDPTRVATEKVVRATMQAKAAAGQAKKKVEEVVEQVKEKVVPKKEDEHDEL